jgi:ABC-2 type transport system ATP-binding protein
MNVQQSVSPDLAVMASGLTKKYGDLVAVDHLDLTVESGTVMALLGPNGAGKTTTVRMLATLELPTSGTASVCGHHILTDSHGVRSSISLTGQFAALEDNLTARENLMLMARLRGMSKSEASKVVGDLIERFDIAEFERKLVKNVSGGQRRRIDLAASLVTKPSLLVLDEPTTGLDPRSRQVVWATIRQLVADGITLLLSTQYLEEADLLADEIVVIDHGHAVARGTPHQLRSRIGEQRVDIVAIDNPGFDNLVSGLGGRFELSLSPERRTMTIPAPDDAHDLAVISAAVRDLGVPTGEIALRRPTLDDAFLALTGHMAEPEELDDQMEVAV